MARIVYDVKLSGKDLKTASEPIAITTTTTTTADTTSTIGTVNDSDVASTDGVTSVFLAGTSSSNDITITSDESVYVKSAGNKSNLKVNANGKIDSGTQDSTVTVMAAGNSGSIDVDNKVEATAEIDSIALSDTATASGDTYIFASGNRGTITAETEVIAEVTGDVLVNELDNGSNATAAVVAEADATGSTTIVANGNRGSVDSSTVVEANIDVSADAVTNEGFDASANITAVTSAVQETTLEVNGNKGNVQVESLAWSDIDVSSEADNTSAEGEDGDAFATVSIDAFVLSTSNIDANGNSGTIDLEGEDSGTHAGVDISLQADTDTREDGDVTTTADVTLGVAAELNLVANGNSGDIDTETNAFAVVGIFDDNGATDGDSGNDDYMATVRDDGDATVDVAITGFVVAHTDAATSGNNGDIGISTDAATEIDVDDARADVQDDGAATVNVAIGGELGPAGPESEGGENEECETGFIVGAVSHVVASGNGGILDVQTTADLDVDVVAETDVDDDGNSSINVSTVASVVAETEAFTPGNHGDLEIENDATSYMNVDAEAEVDENGDSNVDIDTRIAVSSVMDVFLPGNSGEAEIDSEAASDIYIEDAMADVDDDGDTTVTLNTESRVNAGLNVFSPGNSGDVDLYAGAESDVEIDGAEADVGEDGDATVTSTIEQVVNGQVSAWATGNNGSYEITVETTVSSDVDADAYVVGLGEESVDTESTNIASAGVDIYTQSPESSFDISINGGDGGNFLSPSDGGFQPGAGHDSTTVTRSEIFDGEPTVESGPSGYIPTPVCEDNPPPPSEGGYIFVTAEFTGALFDLNGNGQLDLEELTPENSAIFGDGGNVDLSSGAYTIHFVGWGAGFGSAVPIDLSGFDSDDLIIVDWSRDWVGAGLTTASGQVSILQRGVSAESIGFNGYTWGYYNSRAGGLPFVSRDQKGTGPTGFLSLRVYNYSDRLSVGFFNGFTPEVLPGLGSGIGKTKLATWSAQTTIGQSQTDIIWPDIYSTIA